MFSFPYVGPDMDYWYIIWKVKHQVQEVEFEKHLLHTMPLGVGI